MQRNQGTRSGPFTKVTEAQFPAVGTHTTAAFPSASCSLERKPPLIVRLTPACRSRSIKISQWANSLCSKVKPLQNSAIVCFIMTIKTNMESHLILFVVVTDMYHHDCKTEYISQWLFRGWDTHLFCCSLNRVRKYSHDQKNLIEAEGK